jgi:hypothetical protein
MMEMMAREQRITNQQVTEQFKNINSKNNLLITLGKILENQVAQQAACSSHQQGYLPPKPNCNSNASVKAITLRSGMTYDGPEMPDDEIVPKQEKSTEAQRESQSHAEVEQLEGKDCTNASMPK